MSEHQEIEFVYTGIDVADIKKRLEDAGADFIFEDVYRDKVFDYPGLTLNEDMSWVRMRKRGEKTKLAYKQRQKDADGNDVGMKEIEFEVSDFGKTSDFLHAIGMITKNETEKKRTRYTMDGVEFDIDQWPLIPAYLEAEGESEEAINQALEKIGLDPEKKRIVNYWTISQENGIDPIEYTKITFDEQVKRQ